MFKQLRHYQLWQIIIKGNIKSTSSQENWGEEDYNKMQLNNKARYYTHIYAILKKNEYNKVVRIRGLNKRR